jgi:hypothetical protein
MNLQTNSGQSGTNPHDHWVITLAISMDESCAGYEDTEIELLADFLRRTANARRNVTGELAGD